MRFIVDFHIHSHFSRSTAKNLNLENIYIASQLKGITVVGTGDFTHPGWFAEKEKINSVGVPLLGEAILRMRQKKIVVFPGYDGVFKKKKFSIIKNAKKLLKQKDMENAAHKKVWFDKE